MDMKTLEHEMIKNGLAIRAIPLKIVENCEARHIDKYPDGVIYFDECLKRNMLRIERIPKNAGKFIFERKVGTGSLIRFNPKGKYYDTIENIIEEIHGEGTKK